MYVCEYISVCLCKYINCEVNMYCIHCIYFKQKVNEDKAAIETLQSENKSKTEQFAKIEAELAGCKKQLAETDAKCVCTAFVYVYCVCVYFLSVMYERRLIIADLTVQYSMYVCIWLASASMLKLKIEIVVHFVGNFVLCPMKYSLHTYI